MGKKSKREKKKKRGKGSKKRHSSTTSDSSSDSASSSDANPSCSGYQWEDKAAASAPVSAPRSDWFASISEQAMEANLYLGSATSSKIRAAEKERQAQEAVTQAAGLVVNRPEGSGAAGAAPPGNAGMQAPPHNSDWYRRAYRRCQEQAEEQGRSIEEVAAERWGSLEKLRRLMGAEQGSRDGAGGAQLPRWKRRPEPMEHTGDRATDWRRSSGSHAAAYGRETDSDCYRRSETDSRRPESDWRRPKSDSRRPESDSRRPESDSRRPESDSRRPESDWRRSEADSRRPESDSHRPESDLRRNETDSRRPEAESRRPEAESRRPEADSRRPESDSRRPESDLRRPESDLRRPESDLRRPESDSRRPESDSRRLEADSQRTEDATRPKVGEKRLQDKPSTSAASNAAAKPDLVTVEEERHVRIDDINQLSAQILRAQMDRDTVKAGKLEKRLAVMREAQRRNLKVRIKQRVAKTSTVAKAAADAASPAAAAVQPRRPGLNAVGEAATIEELRAHERLIDSRAMQLDFAGAWRPRARNSDDDDAGEYSAAGAAAAKAKRPRQLDKAADRERALAGQKMRAAGRRCGLCLEGESSGAGAGDAEAARLTRGLVVECGPRVYLRLPDVRSLVDKHCLLSSVNHVTCCAQLDDDAFADLARMKQRLVERLGGRGLDCVFVETAKGLGRQPHLLVEAFPMPREIGESAPIYFRKALMEAGPEWASNRKAVPLRDMDIRRTVPPGFAYLAVEFGRDSGLVHVIEDEAAFPDHFGREIVAGMLDLPHELWRRPKRDDWQALLAKASEFRFFWSDSGDAVISQGD